MQAIEIVFLPGLVCDCRIFRSQLATFPNALGIDGYGDRDSLTDMAQYVLSRMSSKVIIFGHSMGGRVAMELFRIAPERVAGIALVSTGVHGVSKGEPEKRAALQAVGREKGFSALIDQWLPPMIGVSNRNNERIVGPLREMCLSMGQAVFDAHVTALLQRQSSENLLSKIDCPALVMTGAEDEWSPPDQHHEIATHITNVKTVIAPGAGHMLMAESPDAVNAALAELIRRVE
ncbi:MAG: alpha/beta hydrolase [Parvularculaceae bacterium]